MTAGLAQTDVILIARGEVELHRKNLETDTQILVGLLSAPAIFGDAEHYAGTGWVVSGTASTDVTIVAMPNAAFDQMVESDGKIAAQLYRDACARHMLVIEIMQMFALQRTEYRILRLLWGLSTVKDGQRWAPFSQVQLVKALGLNRKTIARNIEDLEAEGLIEKHGSEILLKLPDDHPRWRELGTFGLGASWGLAKSR